MKYKYGERELTGIGKLRGALAGKTVALCCSGPTLGDYSDARVPSDWVRIAVNEAIRKPGVSFDYWVLADTQIVLEYAEHCPETTTILAMHQATLSIRKNCKRHQIFTVNSMPNPGRYDNGYEFYSRGTVMIGAIEMARYMGAERFFVFGLDCFALKSHYYFEGSAGGKRSRKPHAASEHRRDESTMVRRGVPSGVRIYCTPKLKKMIEKLNVAVHGWNDLELKCVGSPHSRQTAIEKISWEEFDALVKQERPRKRRGRPKKKKEVSNDQEDRAARVDALLKDEEGRQTEEVGEVQQPEGGEGSRTRDPILQEEVNRGEEEGQRRGPDQGEGVAQEEESQEPEEARGLA